MTKTPLGVLKHVYGAVAEVRLRVARSNALHGLLSLKSFIGEAWDGIGGTGHFVIVCQE